MATVIFFPVIPCLWKESAWEQIAGILGETDKKGTSALYKKLFSDYINNIC